MPKRTDLKKILIIGSGPIVIGQACEFDYSGTQALKALRALGYELVLVNSNPATIMTDANMADATYIEPLNATRLEQIIAQEKPDALLPNLGGQSALNLCAELTEAGVIDAYGVEVIGVSVEAINRGEDRQAFKETMEALGIDMARSRVSHSVEEACDIADELGYPCVLRPAYTMGGTGGGLVYSKDELIEVATRGLAASPIHEVLVEESVLGFEELEFEVVRDAKGQMITVCTIENVDPMGVHTGDSFCVAPMQTVPEATIERLREKSYQIVDAIQVIGGCNVQWAHNRTTDRDIIIEINPRASRSSALASKATGFPIAYVSALLAVGLTLDEISCGKFGSLNHYEAGDDYLVVKFARWAFEKFSGVKDELGTQMRAVGEVMSIGANFKEALQKAIRSLERGRSGLGHIAGIEGCSKEELLSRLEKPTSERYFIIYEALAAGASIEEITERTHITAYFIEQIAEILDEEISLTKAGIAAQKTGNMLDVKLLNQAKCDGFSDAYIAQITGFSASEIRAMRKQSGIIPQFASIHVSGTPDSHYEFSTYGAQSALLASADAPDEPVAPSAAVPKPKIMILGGGPNRIGQGIEFDYCCVHASFALKDLGFQTIMVNCNPETVSTDYDTSDTLYFEPLTVEDVLNIYEQESPLGVITQFGGQTPLNIAAALKDAGVEILGTSPEVIALAEDRDKFRSVMDSLGILMPPSGMAANVTEACTAAHSIGYPVMVRPSFVLGGRNMCVVHTDEEMQNYISRTSGISSDTPVLIDCFLHQALECEADAVCDGKHAFVPAVLEHIEFAGVHSGDSACLVPSVHISDAHIDQIRTYTKHIAESLGVCGLMNIQFAIEGDTVYVLEANPRASRTVPLVSKICAVDMVAHAVNVITAPFIKDTTYELPSADELITHPHYFGVKEAVLPFNMFSSASPVLGPEMRSTGEVLGMAHSSEAALIKALESTKVPVDSCTHALVILEDSPDEDTNTAALHDMLGFLDEAGISVMTKYMHDVSEGLDEWCEQIRLGQIDLVVAPINNKGVAGHIETDEVSELVRQAIESSCAYFTTYEEACAVAHALDTPDHEAGVCSLQTWQNAS